MKDQNIQDNANSVPLQGLGVINHLPRHSSVNNYILTVDKIILIPAEK